MDKKMKKTVLYITGVLLLAVVLTLIIGYIKGHSDRASGKGYTNPDAFSAGTDNSTTFTFEYLRYNSDGTKDSFSQSQGYIEHSDENHNKGQTKWIASDDVLNQVENLVTKYDAVSLFMQYSETPFEKAACADPDTLYYFSFSKEGKRYSFSIRKIILSLNKNSEVVRRVEAFFAELDQVLYNIPAYGKVVYMTDSMQ